MGVSNIFPGAAELGARDLLPRKEECRNGAGLTYLGALGQTNCEPLAPHPVPFPSPPLLKVFNEAHGVRGYNPRKIY